MTRSVLVAVLILVGATHAPAGLIITEVMVNPAADEQVFEFVELYNTGPSSIDLSDMYIGVSGSYDRLESTGDGQQLWVGRYAVVLDPSCISDSGICYSLPADALVMTIESGGFGSNGIPNARGDTVAVLDADSNLVDRMGYRADQIEEGYSLERTDYSADGLDPDNWTASHVAGGTPGAPNDAATALPDRSRMTIGPDIPENTATIELEFTVAPLHIEVGVYDRAGRHVRTLMDGERQTSHVALVWDGRDDHGNPVPTGVYVVLAEGVQVDTGTRRRLTGTAVIARTK